MSLLSPYFLSISNFLNILLATSVIGICAIGSTFVISSAGLDLSVGSVMGLAGVAGAVVMTQFELNWVFWNSLRSKYFVRMVFTCHKFLKLRVRLLVNTTVVNTLKNRKLLI